MGFHLVVLIDYTEFGSLLLLLQLVNSLLAVCFLGKVGFDLLLELREQRVSHGSWCLRGLVNCWY